VTVSPRVLHSVPISVGAEDARAIQRGEIVVDGLDQAGPSFELRIFLNNPDADARTEPTEEHGYAGSIYVYGYGYGGSFGDPNAQGAAHTRLTPTRSVIATDAVRRAAADGPTVSVTLVALPYDGAGSDVDLDCAEVAVLVDDQPA
jgi:hypothetical protein